MNLEQIKNQNIPKRPGSYQFKNRAKEIIYIGKASDLRSRVCSYWQKSAKHSPAKKKMLKEITAVEWIETETEIEAFLLEANLIKKHQPVYNIDLRDDKRFAYIKISTEDEIPGVFITRAIDRSGKYFGPYTNTRAVRETLKVIRKIWPYCTERRIKNKSCFYYQIHRCLGPCGSMVTPAEYNKEVINPIIKFLSGKKKQIIRNIEKEIKLLESGGNSRIDHNDSVTALPQKTEGRLKYLKFKLFNMTKVLEHASIISIVEKYAADVVELAKVLNLPRVPQRIEGYDISNIFGKEAVGSMVVFRSGEPNKSQYRKFKIKFSQGKADDTKMLREVLDRRLAHNECNRLNVTDDGKIVRLKEEKKQTEDDSKIENQHSKTDKWPLPDLIIIDGGKGQLNTALKAVAKAKLDIPVIAISKGAGLRGAAAPDKIFFPGEKKPLELPIASPALHVIKRVRDEAHRFAISYHKLLRKKNFLK